MAGCTSPGAPAPGQTSGPPSTAPARLTFTMGTAASPVSLDAALVSDTESFRVTRQILETLIDVDQNTGVPAPLLATKWEELNDRRSYRFTLRPGVTFHDGTAFDAEAVRANFERWFNLPKKIRPANGRLPFVAVFGAHADSRAESLYVDCKVLGPLEAQLDLSQPYTGLVAALASPAFGISSPAALAKGRADELSQERGGTRISHYGLHPVGTGPFKLAGWEEGTVVLSAFDSYWGAASQVSTVAFKVLSHPAARTRELLAGPIHGYGLVTPGTYADLARNGMQVLQRDPFSVLYLGMNQASGPLADIRMRQAVAHAVDRSTLIDSLFLKGTNEAKQFVPPSLGVNNEQITYYGYDPEQSRALLKAAGYDGEPLTFHYPLNVTRAYLPTPEKVYAELSRQLTAVGFNIKPVPVAWDDGYLQQVQGTDDHALHLAGLSGSYRDPDNFVGSLFGAPSAQFGFDSPVVFNRIARAKALPNGPERTQAYVDINDLLARRLPALPLAFPISALAMGPQVQSYPANTMLDEVFNLVQLRAE
ncbi:ABC transporter substrate-binding protein [Arthrobacter deserti]|uniref:ABC transporter substrate-binding protein n=1 Tax=Arthrobacter deserti TaxID=1742687 RepID=A0ABX1JQ12_9MICC|nr:ABC transporter substrate-binding protein [Arthrobacter deserti]